MVKRLLIRGFSKKFKGTQKLPAQKSPSRFSAMQKQATAESKVRKVFGELPETMGMSQKATGDILAEGLAYRTMDKKFFRTFSKELGRSRARTESGILARTSKGIKVPKTAIKKAKSKGAMKSYGIATKKSEDVFRKTMETFTTKTKASPFAKKSRAVPKQTEALADSREIQHIKKVFKDMGF